MRRCSLSLALLLSLSVAGSLGCKKSDPEADGRKVTAESTYDATQPIVHEGFRFRLEQPGPGWKLMRKEDIRRMMPDAVAGAASAEGTWGAVIVERLPGVTLDQAEGLVGAALPNAVVQSTEDTTFGGLPARRTVLVATIEGVEFRYMRVLFLREGFLYQLLSWGPSATTTADALAPFSAAVSLTEGELRGEADDRPPVEHADGVTWQIRDGRFASVVSGLQLPAVPAWRYLVGQELAQTNAEAELALANDQAGAYIAVISERYEGDDPSGMVSIIRNGLAQNLGPGTDAGSRSIGGRSVAFTRHQTEAALEFQVGVMTGDGAVTQVLAWYPQALASTAVPAIEQVLGTMTLASASEREALREQLLAREGVVWTLAAESVFLGDTFRDFAHQLTWAQPRGLFEIQVGDEAKANGAHVVLSLRAPLPSVYANLEVVEHDGAQLRSYHENVAGTFEDRRDEPAMLDAVTGQRSRGRKHVGGVPFEFGVLSVEHQGNAVIMTAWGPASSPGMAATIDQVLGGLRLPAVLPEITTEDGRFIDHHYGVSVREPTGAWQRSDMTPAGLPVGRVTRWSSGTRELVLISSSVHGIITDEAWMTSFAEQTVRDRMAAGMSLGEPKSSRDTLDGQPSRRLVYDQAQIEIALRDGALTMLVVSNVDEAEVEGFRRSLKWQR